MIIHIYMYKYISIYIHRNIYTYTHYICMYTLTLINLLLSSAIFREILVPDRERKRGPPID